MKKHNNRGFLLKNQNLFRILRGRELIYRVFFVTILFSVAAATLPSSAIAAKIGLIFTPSGRDDNSFNSAAYKGAVRAQKKLGISLKTVTPSDINAVEGLLRKFARKKFDLTIAVGFQMHQAVERVAKQFPNAKFAVVDSKLNLPNVKSLLFSEHEGAFLVGAIAAMKSESGQIGFIGGMDVPMIRRFQLGYEAGAKMVNPKVKVLTNYIGVTTSAWSNPSKAKELALTQYDQGAEVIFHASGSSGMGLFDAAEQRGRYAIGVDSNQNSIKPGTVLTSMVKRVDVAVFNSIMETVDKRFTAGIEVFGLSKDGVGYALDTHNRKLFSEIELNRVKDIKDKIIAQKIRVPDYYQSLKK